MPLPIASPPNPAQGSAETVELQPIRIDSRGEDEDSEFDLELGPVTAVLTSTAAVGFFSSATFHLLLLGATILVTQLLGLNWLQLNDDSPPLMASLGDEDVLDDAALFEFVGDLSKDIPTPASSLQQVAKVLQPSESGNLMMAYDDVLNNLPGSEAQDPSENGSGFLLKVPESGLAVTKGSFTAFTIPASPKPRENYSIVIEVRLPDDVKEYRVSDLTGDVRGSDGYKQKLPYDSRTPYASGYPGDNDSIRQLEASTVLDVVRNRVQIVIKVPGAGRLVKDVITIRSRKLKEEQELTLVFGGVQDSSSSSDSPQSTKSMKKE
jgi:hypothetical protein